MREGGGIPGWKYMQVGGGGGQVKQALAMGGRGRGGQREVKAVAQETRQAAGAGDCGRSLVTWTGGWYQVTRCPDRP